MNTSELATKEDLRLLSSSVQKDIQRISTEIQGIADLISDALQMINDRFDRVESMLALHSTILNNHELRLNRLEEGAA